MHYPECKTHIFHQYKTGYDFSQNNNNKKPHQNITSLVAYILLLTASF